MSTMYCNIHNCEAEETDVDTLYLDFDGMEDAYVCEECEDFWISEGAAQRLSKGEADCEAKMA